MPTATPFNNLITFSRGSNATVTGSNGLIQWAPNNLLTFSEQFDNAVWGKVRITAAANTSLAPDGTTTADTLNGSGGGTTSISQTMPAVGGLHTATVYAKAGTKSVIQFSANAFAWGADARANFDIANGVLGTVDAGLTATITPTGDGWYRCAVTANKAATAGALLWCIVDSTTAAREAAATAGSVIFWGAQLEIGSTATTYNPTTVKNLLGFSEAFDNAAWTKVAASIVTGAQANPVNGLFNAQKFMEDTANNLHRVFLGASVSSGVPYVYSAYAKAAERSRIQLTSSAGVSLDAIFDLSNGTVVTAASGTASIVSVGGGWYRCSVLNTAASSTSTNLQIRLIQSGTVNTYTGDGNSGVYIYGAQLSDSASLDPYVPTPGAAPSSTAFYGPRFDFDPVTLQPRGLLVEEARTNLLPRSEEFDNASWSKNNSTITANATQSPDGTVNADKLNETATTAFFNVAQTPTLAISTTYTLSCYMKAAERGFGVLNIFTGAASCWTWYNLSTGVVSTLGAGATATISPAGSGWYRCTLTIATAATGSPNIAIFPAATNGVLSYAGTAGSGIFLYGAQLEAGAFATSYIPTVASTVTRSADVATITGQNFAQWYRQDEGAFVAEFDALTSASLGSANVLSAYASGTNLNRIWMWTGAPGVVRNSVVSGGSGVSELTGATLVANTPLKAASSYRVDSYAFTTNGGAVGSDTSGALPVGISVLGVGNIGGPSEYLNGHIRNIRFIPARAADFQLQALST